MTSYSVKTQFTPDFIYCTSSGQQFAFIHNTMFNSKTYNSVGPYNLCTICSYKSTDYSFIIKCMSQYLKMGNMIFTEKYTLTQAK